MSTTPDSPASSDAASAHLTGFQSLTETSIGHLRDRLSIQVQQPLKACQCIRAVLAYGIFLSNVDRLFAATDAAARTSAGKLAITAVRQAEAGSISDTPAHTNLFAELVSQLSQKTPHDDIQLERDTLRPITMLVKTAQQNPCVGFIAITYIYLAYQQFLRDHLYQLFVCADIDPAGSAYFAANPPQDIEYCQQMLLDGLASEIEAPDSGFHDVSIHRVIRTTEQFLLNILQPREEKKDEMAAALHAATPLHAPYGVRAQAA